MPDERPKLRAGVICTSLMQAVAPDSPALIAATGSHPPGEPVRPWLARALLVADGQYEWLRSEDPKQPRQPFRFTVDDGEPFAFAALWTRRRLGDELVESAVLLTTEANAVARKVLHRMPVILPGPAEEELWLSGDVDDALELARPLDPERMDLRPRTRRSTKWAGVREGPELLVAPGRD